MSTPDTTGSNESARDAAISHLPDHIRRAIEITPAAGTRERIIDITTLGRRTGRPRRIQLNVRPCWGRSWRISISPTTPAPSGRLGSKTGLTAG